jgi:hypothetical protein
MKVNKQYSRNFLIAASAYRRQVRERAVSFSAQMLAQQYAHETFGAPKPDASTNGYTLGKWTLDVVIKAMKDDFNTGLFTKFELCKGSCAFVRKSVRAWPAVEFFGYRAPVAKQVDAKDLKSFALGHAGSTPARRTTSQRNRGPLKMECDYNFDLYLAITICVLCVIGLVALGYLMWRSSK